MKAEDLTSKSVDELEKTLLDLKKQQFNMRFQKSQGQLSNTAQIRNVRRDVARVKTILTQKRNAETQSAKAANVGKKSGKAA